MVPDAETQGNWGSKYGRDGFVLCDYDEANGKTIDRRQLPDYVASVDYSLNANIQWQADVTDARAPAPSVTNGFPRNVGCIYTQDPQGGFQTMTVDIQLAKPKDCQITLYFVDGDRKGRREAVEMFDRATLQRIAPVQMVRDFSGGKYLIYRYNRSVRFASTKCGDNPTLSGRFFD